MSHLVVSPDDPEGLRRDLRFLLDERPAVLVISGGLGTTHDLTAETAAAVTGRPLADNPEALRMVTAATRRVAERRGLAPEKLLPEMVRQARLPAGSRALAPAGVAPSFIARHDGTRDRIDHSRPRGHRPLRTGA